jgi:calcium/calmodulin-dependent protein kinase (CaM kinase) II
MAQSTETQLVALTQQLLRAIGAKDWAKYVELCDESLTCFEPEARGHLVEGLDFHKYYFDLPSGSGHRQTTLSSPHVRLLGPDVAIVSYVRLVQFCDAAGQPQTVPFEETRVWQQQHGQWKHVHFHRSQNA